MHYDLSIVFLIRSSFSNKELTYILFISIIIPRPAIENVLENIVAGTAVDLAQLKPDPAQLGNETKSEATCLHKLFLLFSCITLF